MRRKTIVKSNVKSNKMCGSCQNPLMVKQVCLDGKPFIYKIMCPVCHEVKGFAFRHLMVAIPNQNIKMVQQLCGGEDIQEIKEMIEENITDNDFTTEEVKNYLYGSKKVERGDIESEDVPF